MQFINWEHWIRHYKHELDKHPVGFEEKFVREVLMHIPEITPDDVRTQVHFKDNKGGNRYIDFVIQNDKKGYRLPIELDGKDKFSPTSKRLQDHLDRQKDIIRLYGSLYRCVNWHAFTNSNQVIADIQEMLHEQAQRVFLQRQKDQQLKQLQDTIARLTQEKQQQINPQSTIESELLTLKNQMAQILERLEQIKNTPLIKETAPVPTPAISKQAKQAIQEDDDGERWAWVIGLLVVGVGVLIYSATSSKGESYEEEAVVINEPQELMPVQSVTDMADADAVAAAAEAAAEAAREAALEYESNSMVDMQPVITPEPVYLPDANQVPDRVPIRMPRQAPVIDRVEAPRPRPRPRPVYQAPQREPVRYEPIRNEPRVEYVPLDTLPKPSRVTPDRVERQTREEYSPNIPEPSIDIPMPNYTSIPTGGSSDTPENVGD